MDLSLDALGDVDVKKAKFFRSLKQPTKTVLCFLGKQARNISLVVDQQELCDKVIGDNILRELGIDVKGGSSSSSVQILDFTLLNFSLLVVLLNTSDLVVFDCQQVLAGGSGSVGQVRYLDKFPLSLSSESQAK